MPAVDRIAAPRPDINPASPRSSSVSVIIPAYNADRFLREAVESALAQTHKAFEVIVVDDGSTDGTAAILEQFRGRIKVISQGNQGLASARNAGARAAGGEWLAFLDADDYWAANKIERQLGLVHAGVDLIYSDRFNVGDRGSVPELHSDFMPLYEGDVFLDLLIVGNLITASSVLVRRSTFQMLGGFFDGAPGTEDWDLWIHVAAERGVRVCREPLVYYRLHSCNMSRNTARMSAARLAVTRRALELPRGRALGRVLKRRIWSKTWMSNGADALRADERLKAIVANLRAACYWPFALRPYKEALRAGLGI